MRYWGILILFLLTFFVKSQSLIGDDDHEVHLHELEYEMVIDSNNHFSIKDQNLPWRKVKGIHFVDHLAAPHALFKFRVTNAGSVDRQLFMHADLHWESVLLYQDGEKIGVSGKTVTRKNKTIDDNFQIIPILLKKGTQVELVFDVNSQINYGTRISLISPTHFLKKELSARKSLSFFYGILAVLFVFNLIWFLVTKEKLRLAYCFYVFAMAFYSGKADNFVVYSLLPDFTSLLYYEYFFNKLVLALGLGTYIWMYLLRDEQNKKVAALVKYITIAYVVQYIIELGITGTSYYYHSLVLLVWGYVALVCSTQFLRRKEYLLIGALFFVALGVSTSMLQALNWRSFTTQFTIYATDYSFMVDALFFAIITAKKVRDSSKEKIELQEELIVQMSNNEALNVKVNLELEEKVKARTHDIETQNIELESLNKKLKVQSEQIMKMNEQLDLSNYNLKKENKKVKEKSIVGVPLSLSEVQEIYPNQVSCLHFLENLKWKEGFSCRKCSNSTYQDLEQMKGKRCTKCGASETITTGTLFERLRIPLDVAFYIAYVVYYQKEKIKVSDLSDELDVNMKTCYNFINKCNQRDRTSWESFVYNK